METDEITLATMDGGVLQLTTISAEALVSAYTQQAERDAFVRAVAAGTPASEFALSLSRRHGTSVLT